MSATVKINPRMLYWAISRAGIAVEDLTTALPKLPAWLAAEAQPTVKQLETFSKKVHLPFGYLLLPEPPKEHLPFTYFRQGKAAADNTVSLNVYDTILAIQQRQQWLSEYLKDEGHAPLPFVGKYKVADGCASIVADIRQTLKLTNDWAAPFKTTADAMKHLVERTEDAGIIVVINGIVGNSTRRRLDPEECRGFVMVDRWAPFLFINNTDAEPAKMFTLLHELAHVWLGHSAGFDTNKLLPADDPIEKLCDEVAAEFLVPEHLFEAAWKENPDFGAVARKFKVSTVVAARRALDLHKISKPQFFAWYAAWQEEWKAKQGGKGGGDFYNNQPNRVSLRFAGLIEQAVRSQKLSYREAYRLTGLHGDSYHNFIQTKLR
ncbi:MAG: ImmA/IrrE family metallo-endopeptidase [Bacteroidetes bacterium]|nr:ImmA/IrrE family metallo-endopeptidase [Bacteroidota bacterium]